MESGGSLVLRIVSLVALSYYATTFSIWFGHSYSHRPASVLRRFHMLGHHVLYPDSKRTRHAAAAYLGGQGATNSAFSLLPWLLLQALLFWLCLPWPWFGLCLAEQALILLLINYVHEQFHVPESRLVRFAWFLRARAVHDLHHDEARNFMVVDHFWDRAFRTFRAIPPS